MVVHSASGNTVFLMLLSSYSLADKQYKVIGAENRHPLKEVVVVLLKIHLLHLSKENIVPLKEEGNPRNSSQLATRRPNCICQMFKGGLVTHGLEMLCCQY